jgi:L-alanine-DL-glutamate epimerase-like enolase superfamily enzyme
VEKLGIRSARLTRVSIPLTMVHAGSMYVIQKTERTVIELTLENGVTGLGETWGTPEAYALTGQFAKGWVGKDVLDRFALRDATLGKSSYDNRNGRNGLAAFAGLDLAAWDAAARSLGLSLAELIGGRHRESIDVVCTLPAAILPRAVSRKELTEHLDVLGNTGLVVRLPGNRSGNSASRASS